MEITFQLPDEIVGIVKRKQPDVARLALEAMAVAIYSRGLIGRAQVGKLLGFDSRFETEEFLHQAGASRPYDLEDFERDLEIVASTSAR